MVRFAIAMRVRTQLAVVGVVALGYGAGNAAFVRPVLPDTTAVERLQLGELESLVVRESGNTAAARALTRRYLELEMPRRAIESIRRTTRMVQEDGLVSLYVARAEEKLGEVRAAQARVTGALNRCTNTPAELVEASGCDVRAQTELAIELTALERMVQWNITPLTDPDRAALAHDMAVRPIRVGIQTR